MKFKFKIQQYQTDAENNTVDVFSGQPSKTSDIYRRDLGNTDNRIVYEDEYTSKVLKVNVIEYEGKEYN